MNTKYFIANDDAGWREFYTERRLYLKTSHDFAMMSWMCSLEDATLFDSESQALKYVEQRGQYHGITESDIHEAVVG